jgi:hypothetical protein
MSKSNLSVSSNVKKEDAITFIASSVYGAANNFVATKAKRNIKKLKVAVITCAILIFLIELALIVVLIICAIHLEFHPLNS